MDNLKGGFQLELNWVQTAIGRAWIGSPIDLPLPWVSSLPGQFTELTACAVPQRLPWMSPCYSEAT